MVNGKLAGEWRILARARRNSNMTPPGLSRRGVPVTLLPLSLDQGSIKGRPVEYY
jgi:hypothetical protein